MADDLTCAETIDETPARAFAAKITKHDLEEVQKIKENEDKTAKEIELYHEIKRYIVLLNEEVTIE